MATIPLSWKLSVDGANEVKTKLNEIQSAFQRGEISTKDYAKGMREVTRDARTFTNISRTQSQVFLAMHPRLNALSRGLSTVSSITRTATSLMNAFNIAQLVNIGRSSQELDVKARIAEVLREINRTSDPEKLQALNEQLAILKAQLTEISNGNLFTGISTVIFSIAGAVYGIKEGIKIITSLGPALTGIGASLAGGLLQFASMFANSSFSNGIAFFASQLLELIPGMNRLRQIFADWLKTWAIIDGSFLDTEMMKFFQDIPNIANQAWESMIKTSITGWNSIIDFTENGINGVIIGFSKFVNMIISGFNTIIRGINKIPGFSIPIIPQFKMEGISLPRINSEVSKPSSIPSNAGSIQYVITNNVQGSILTEKELMSKVDDYIKQSYKTHGFTGFQ